MLLHGSQSAVGAKGLSVPSRLQAERARGECALAQQAGALAAARRARTQLQAQHERERTALRERARTLQRRLAALDSEYSAQLDSLRAAYQVRLTATYVTAELKRQFHLTVRECSRLFLEAVVGIQSSAPTFASTFPKFSDDGSCENPRESASIPAHVQEGAGSLPAGSNTKIILC